MMAYMARSSHVGNARAEPSVPERAPGIPAPGIRETVAISIFGVLFLVAIVVTYTRLPPAELYNTSVGGLRGGFGRALVSTGFPLALIALAMTGVLANALIDARRRLVIAIACVAIPLCATTAFVVKQGDLDAAPRNALPALGVALVGVLLVVTVHDFGVPPTPRARGDRLRLVLALRSRGSSRWSGSTRRIPSTPTSPPRASRLPQSTSARTTASTGRSSRLRHSP
jgi:hypothetical protein